MLFVNNTLKIIYFILCFLEYFADSYTPCIIFLMGINQVAVFSRGFLYYHLLKMQVIVNFFDSYIYFCKGKENNLLLLLLLEIKKGSLEEYW